MIDKILGLDIGKKRIGISMSDAMGLIAHPVETINREPETAAIEKIKEICQNNGVKKIVAGLPKNMNNTVGEQAQDCIDFMEKIIMKLFLKMKDLQADKRNIFFPKQAENIRKIKNLLI